MYFSWFNFFLGLTGVGLGIWVTVNAYHVNHDIWYFSWAERKLGPGMGTIAYRWIGIAFAIFSVLVMFGQINLTGDRAVDPIGPNPGKSTVNTSIPNASNVQIAP